MGGFLGYLSGRWSRGDSFCISKWDLQSSRFSFFTLEASAGQFTEKNGSRKTEIAISAKVCFSWAYNNCYLLYIHVILLIKTYIASKYDNISRIIVGNLLINAHEFL